MKRLRTEGEEGEEEEASPCPWKDKLVDDMRDGIVLGRLDMASRIAFSMTTMGNYAHYQTKLPDAGLYSLLATAALDHLMRLVMYLSLEEKSPRLCGTKVLCALIEGGAWTLADQRFEDFLHLSAFHPNLGPIFTKEDMILIVKTFAQQNDVQGLRLLRGNKDWKKLMAVHKITEHDTMWILSNWFDLSRNGPVYSFPAVQAAIHALVDCTDTNLLPSHPALRCYFIASLDSFDGRPFLQKWAQDADVNLETLFAQFFDPRSGAIVNGTTRSHLSKVDDKVPLCAALMGVSLQANDVYDNSPCLTEAILVLAQSRAYDWSSLFTFEFFLRVRSWCSRDSRVSLYDVAYRPWILGKDLPTHAMLNLLTMLNQIPATFLVIDDRYRNKSPERSLSSFMSSVHNLIFQCSAAAEQTVLYHLAVCLYFFHALEGDDATVRRICHTIVAQCDIRFPSFSARHPVFVRILHAMPYAEFKADVRTWVTGLRDIAGENDE